MVYTEIKCRKNKKYYYRVKSVKEKGKVKKERVYLGVNIKKGELGEKESEADKKLLFLNNLLTAEEIKLLDKLKKIYLKQPKENFENRYEFFCSLFTYNSNAIEGNTLTLQETAQLLFDRITPKASLREINETLNHKKAFDYILRYKKDITREFILNLHELVTKNTLKKLLESQIGKYRTLQVYIRGVDWIPTKPQEVPKEMASLLRWYSRNKKKLHPMVVASYFHSAFESIHPFVDGNGRVGRLLMNFILHKNRLPMVNIPNKQRKTYYKTLQESQLKGNLKPFVKFILDLLRRADFVF